MTTRATRPGVPIRSLDAIARAADAKRSVYLRGKPTPAAVLMRMTVTTVLGFLRKGMVRRTVQVRG